MIEGAATQLIPNLAKPDNPLHGLWEKNKISRSDCRHLQGLRQQKWVPWMALKREGLELLDEMNGHPAMSTYLQGGFEVISF